MIGGVSIEGMEGIPAALEAKITAVIGSVDGTAIEVVASGARGQTKNTIIGKVQQELGRDPFYVDEQGKEALRFAARGTMAAQYSVRQRAVEIMRELLLMTVHRNVERQRNPDGAAFKALSPNYAAYKRRRFGFVTPILRATGDFLDGLTTRVKKMRQ